MIRIVFWQEEGGALAGFTISGHAGYRPKGEDIVCAAVSALAQTAVLSLKEHLAEEPEVRIEEGFLECRLPPSLKSSGKERARVILETIATGLKAIARDYKEYLRLEYRRV
ncbi:ribosomal-processing cysteine protease Prp [Moorella sulfitireducens]|uniref:ribosomal-processing cysteine protease Prp n=1 Tax=Neomoorella sulfitireducens TaxID=2972948 RepID=UPI0021AB9F16|nr:ribosomal-processing cysteine protease Prp [Moorella sulfitireducens]